MIKKLYAVSLIDRLKGGTTKPCIMEVCDENGNNKNHYVVKIFTQKDETQVQATVKEFIANQLAIEFDLCVPDAALVFVREEIIKELQEQYNYTDIKIGWYFATLYLTNIIEYQKGFTTTKTNLEVQQKVFAFDMLIQNRDRRIGKPNCFTKNGECYLIDHELSLEITKSYDYYIKQGEYQNLAIGYAIHDREHIFYNTLKSKKASNFDEFQLYLHQLNLSMLTKVVTFLATERILIDVFENIEPYLQAIKRDSTNFCQTLKHIVS
jgi:hypothetical protein